MSRQKDSNAAPQLLPPKKHQRSRFGCKECKRLKMKCDEMKPLCSRCVRRRTECDYSITLNWDGRSKKKKKTVPAPTPDIPNQFMVNELNTNISNDGLTSISPPVQVNPNGSSNFLEELGQSIQALSYNEQNAVVGPPHITTTATETATQAVLGPEDAFPLDESQSFSSHEHEAKRRKTYEDVDHLQIQTVKPETVDKDYMARYLEESLGSGIQSLTSALKNIVGDKATINSFGRINLLSDLNSFNLSSSNNSVSGLAGPDLVNDIPSHPVNDQFSNPGDVLDDLLLDFDNYHEDLVKIDKAFDLESSGPSPFPFLGRHTTSSRPSRVVDVSGRVVDSDDEEDAEETLLKYNKRVKLLVNENPNSLMAPSPASPSSSSSSSSLDSYDQFYIPKSIPPLPDLLLNVPYYLESFHFFRDVTSTTLVPLPLHAYKENPFKVILPRLAMANESVLSILILFGIAHKSFMLGQKEPKEVLDQLLSRCLKEVIMLLEDKETSKSDLTLLLVLMIASFDLFSSIKNNWKLHVQGAKQILLKRGLQSPINRQQLVHTEKIFPNIDRLPITVSTNFPSKNSNVTEFLVGWFTYIDMLSTLATPLNPRTTKGKERSQKKLKFSVSGSAPRKASYLDDEEDVEIDMFLGFDVRFLDISVDLVSLIQRTNLYLSERDTQLPLTLPQDLMVEAIEIRENLALVFRTSSMRYAGLSDEDQVSVLKYTNELFYKLLCIHLFRRVFLVPRESAIVRSLCSSTIKILQDKIIPGSNLETCSSFAIFSALLEAIDPQDRKFFLDRLKDQFHIGNYLCKKIKEVLILSWSLEKDWTEIVELYKIDLTFI